MSDRNDKVMEQLEAAMISGVMAVATAADQIIGYAAKPLGELNNFSYIDAEREKMVALATMARKMALAVEALGRLHTSLYYEKETE